jgi:hypothetical protein
MDLEPENPTPETPTPPAQSQSEPADAPTQPTAPAEPNPAEADEDDQINRRRRGFVALLPKKLRDQVCYLILDGLPYKKIIESLGEAGSHISPGCITEWKQGGFNDWLDDLQRAEDVGRTRDAALALVEQKAGATVQDAGRTIISAQLYELLLSFDPRAFAAALQEKPELYCRLINALSRLSEGEAACSRRRAQGTLIEDQLTAAQNGDGNVVIPADKLNQLIRLIKLL